VAWLSTAPERLEGDKSNTPLLTRRQQLDNDGEEPELPACDAPELVQYLFEAGPVLYSGMGPVPLTYIEIESWQRIAGQRLTPWECSTLRRLSQAFADQTTKAAKRDCPAPYTSGEPTLAHRKEVDRKLRDFFGNNVAKQ
jgi:hypothetical protein